ncbi:MAG: transcriptional regulator [Rubrivivax sp.]|jgi:hypothetical protein|nr:transcriptional regulator [Rubrivivax sp.]MCL4697757.1 hypothetical protein [Burkholderiaceae bacterium]
MSHPELTGRPSPMDRRAQALVRAARPSAPQRQSATRKLAAGLGWFGLGLGLVQLFATRRVLRAGGLGTGPAALGAASLCGLREVATGIGLVAARSPAQAAPWMWARVAGDALDLAALTALVAMPGRAKARPLLALAAVAGVAALDLACARTLRAEASAARQSTDYSDRSGLAGAYGTLRALPGAADAPRA